MQITIANPDKIPWWLIFEMLEEIAYQYPDFTKIVPYQAQFGRDVNVYELELKVPKGKQSDNQKWWQSVVERCNSSYYIVRTLEEFQELINLNINKMSDNLKVTGKVVHIGAIETVSDKFKKRIIAVETGGDYPQTVAVEFTQDKCELLDKYSVNEEITIHFNLRGREWNGKYFTNLNGWRIESDAVQGGKDSNQIGSGDLPF